MIETEDDELLAVNEVTHTAQETVEPGFADDVDVQYIYDNIDPAIVTAGENGIMSMSQFVAAGHPEGNFWIADANGWFYWNGFIEPETATSLLLDAVEIPTGLGRNWEYAITVGGEFFLAEDIEDGAGMDDITDGVREMVQIAVDNLPIPDPPGAYLVPFKKETLNA